MFYNPALFLALPLAVFFFLAGRFAARRWQSKRAIAGALTLLLALPGLSFLAYYLHLTEEPRWYIEYRSIPYMEVAGSLCGFPAGFLTFRKRHLQRFDLRVLNVLFLLGALLLTLVPFVKPLISPVKRLELFADNWRDGVCLQSTGSTCGPASLATVLSLSGVKRTEEEIARACFTCSGGTENWYLLRYARRCGLRAECFRRASLAEVAYPAMIGTYVGYGRHIGHFITLLGREDGRYVFGDPLKGRFTATPEEFSVRYTFSGFVLTLEINEK